MPLPLPAQADWGLPRQARHDSPALSLRPAPQALLCRSAQKTRPRRRRLACRAHRPPVGTHHVTLPAARSSTTASFARSARALSACGAAAERVKRLCASMRGRCCWRP